ncbi:DUF1127 domain-containing protein [Marinomonas spartinae]|uniref:DUF1127 domain-containing protein n=1 Tax=Marinomonas spartinae TaxID=1792290 RepID=UPI0018F1C010|nr:DUF1127 domain-containing protein [Marinomonas spartinae]MBJ7555660.1 DUF1127 domain-containing protein [Marinomonas spartinae]
MLMIALLVHIKQCVQSYRTRKVLLYLTADELKDVGISEGDRRKQTAKASLLGMGKEILMFKRVSKSFEKKVYGDV